MNLNDDLYKINQDRSIYCISVYNSNTVFGIELRDPKKLYCSNIDGIFIYKKTVFKYHGKFLDEFFESTNQTVKFRCMKPNELMYDGDDEVFGSWSFIVKNKKLKCIFSSVCDKFWADKNYFKADN